MTANHFYREFNFVELDALRLERALNRLIAHYPEMRLIFDQYNLTQRYLAFDKQTYYRIETIIVSEPYEEKALLTVRNQLSHHVYDISLYPLFNVSLTHFSDRVVLHFSFDMILFDLKTVTQFYTLLTSLYHDETFVLPKTAVNFRDYQCYMNLLKSSYWYAIDKAYWQEKIKTMPLRPQLGLACDPHSLEQPQFKMNYQFVGADVWLKFKRQTECYGVSAGSVLLGLYGFILSHCSDNPDFLITLTLLNRYNVHPDVDSLWGDFTSVNLFAFLSQKGSALEVLKHTHDSLWNDMAHALYSGLNVQRDLMVLHRLDPSLAVSPLVFTCVLDDSSSGVGSLPYFLNQTERPNERYLIGQTSQAWIDLQVTEQEGCLYSHWLYVEQLFSEHFISELNNHYCSLITYLAEHDWDMPLPPIALMLENAQAPEHKYLDRIREHLNHLSGVDQILLREQDDSLLAYLVEPALPLMMDEQKMEAFKLGEKGLRLDLQDEYAFKLALDEGEFRRYKSYRNFNSVSLTCEKPLLPELAIHHLSIAGRCLNHNELPGVFSPLSALRLNDKMLAKYKYPSAGHSYSIQTYLHVPYAFGDLSPGLYYYHPVAHSLQRIQDAELEQDLSLEFRIYRPAIEPLYTEDWLRFAYIELGHMLYLLNEFIQEMGMGYDFNWCNPHEPTSEFYPLARLVFGSETSKIAKQLNAHLMHKTAGIFSDGYRSIDTKNHSLLMRLSAVGQVLETAPALVFFEGVNDKNSWVQAGFQAQYLTGYWQQFKLGSCALAYRPSIDSVYALALGAIASEEELLAETKPPVKACLDEQLTTALSQLESEGRLPDAYIIVNHLPLTDEGAIDWKSLPIPDIALAEWEYQAPESELESLFCEVWQEVLGIKQIGILDDFFRLGGHSISCMQVTAKLRQLGIDCSVKSIFEHRCIKGVLPYTQAIVINEIEEQQIDEADNFIYADLSSELIEFLQQSYE